MSPYLLVLVVASGSVSTAFAHPGGHESGDYVRPSSRPPEPAPLPETLLGVATALRERAGAASTALAAGKVVDLNRSCTDMTELIAALPSRSSGLSPEAQTKVTEVSGKLGPLVAALREAGSRADRVGGQQALEAMGEELDALDALAP